MSVIHAIILGIIQGITEFLPVSSFGHLCGVQDLLGGTRGSGVLFEVMLHLGTMISSDPCFSEGYQEDWDRADRNDTGSDRKCQYFSL